MGYVTQEFAAGSGFHFILPFLRDRDAILAEARSSNLRGEQLQVLADELEQALELADDEATLVMANIKSAWGL